MSLVRFPSWVLSANGVCLEFPLAVLLMTAVLLACFLCSIHLTETLCLGQASLPLVVFSVLCFPGGRETEIPGVWNVGHQGQARGRLELELVILTIENCVHVLAYPRESPAVPTTFCSLWPLFSLVSSLTVGFTSSDLEGLVGGAALLTCGDECCCLVPLLPTQIIAMVNSSTWGLVPGHVGKDGQTQNNSQTDLSV